MLSRLSLRARLLLGVIAIAFAGLVTADVATYAALKSFLIDRVDTALNSVHQGVEASSSRRAGGGARRGAGRREHPGRVQPDPRLLPRAEDARRGGGDEGVLHPAVRTVAARAGREAARDDRASDAADHAAGRPLHFFTVPAVSGGGSYRVRASTEARDPTHVLLIAAPLNDVNSTLHRLLLIELGVTVAVLCTMILLGLWIVRLGLRPLEKMGKTAGAIAAGDLSRRVEPAERAHGDRPARARAQLDARAHRGGGDRARRLAAGARGVGEQAPALRRRRLARAPHAARSRASLRRALHARRLEAPGRSRAVDEGHQPRVRAHERPRRGPAAPGAPRRGAPARAQEPVDARRRRRRGARDGPDARARRGRWRSRSPR